MKMETKFWIYGIIMLIIALCFWGFIIFIGWHFISKWW